MKAQMTELFDGCMAGRTMYVIPFVMGHLGADVADVRRPGHRLALRRRLHAHHDPHGRQVLDKMRRRTPTSCRACTRSAPRSPKARPMSPGRATPTEVHRPLPRRAHDLVLRLRLRRQRPARQEVLRPAHRLGHGPRRGLDGRAHAHPQASPRPQGEKTMSRRPSPAPAARRTSRCSIPPDVSRGWKVTTVGDDIAWMRVGDGRPAPRREPRGRLLRRRPRHQREDQPQRHGTIDRGNTIFTNVALTDDGDVWWEGMTEEPPAHCIDWTGPTTGRPDGEPSAPPTPTAASPRRGSQCPMLDPDVRQTPTACRSTRSSSAAAAARPCRWSTRPHWQHGVYHRRHALLGDHRRRHRRRRRRAPRPDGDAALHRLQRRRLHDPLARIGKQPSLQAARDLPRQLVPHTTRKATSSGPASARTCRVLKWIIERLDGDADAVETPIGFVPTGRPRHRRARHDARAGRQGRSRRGRLGEGAAPHPGVVRHVRRAAPRGAVGRVRRPQGPRQRALRVGPPPAGRRAADDVMQGPAPHGAGPSVMHRRVPLTGSLEQGMPCGSSRCGAPGVRHSRRAACPCHPPGYGVGMSEGNGYRREESEAERLDRNFGEQLQELRIVQTGVQILFAFLLTIPFQQRFTSLTQLQRTSTSSRCCPWRSAPCSS